MWNVIKEQFCWRCHSWIKPTWHHHEWSLWLHGNEAGTEDGGGICCGDATHAANLLQLFADCLQGALPEQDTPVCKGKAPWQDRAEAEPAEPALTWKQQNIPDTWISLIPNSPVHTRGLSLQTGCLRSSCGMFYSMAVCWLSFVQ